MVRSTLEFNANFDTLDAPTQNAVENPQEVTSLSEAVIRNAANGGMPEIEIPHDNFVLLAQGIMRDGFSQNEAEVRELTGDDEEALAKTGGNWLRFLETIILRGTVSVGGEPMTKKLADELLIGDREDLIMGVRRATFGDAIEIEDYECTGCGKRSDLTVNLDAIPRVKLRDRQQTTYRVELRNMHTAEVRFPTGADQHAIYADQEATIAEQNTTLLSRCMLRLDEDPSNVKTVKSLGMADRRKILKFLNDKQPGPRFNKIEYTHDVCGTVIKLPLGLADMFLGL